jgi:two-component system invasion response regulator UvrY
MNDHNKIKLAIVDDHNLFRKGLIKLISLGDTNNRYHVLFEADNGEDMKDKLQLKQLPDIIMMDIMMQEMDGYEAVEWLKKYHPEISILVISTFETEEAIVRMVKLGVQGYLSKDIEVSDVHAALDAISAKGFYFTEQVTGVMAQSMQNEGLKKPEEHWNTMSENEREFLKLACTEYTYHQIADKMRLSPKTIDGYREDLFKRFNVKSRVVLALFAVRNGLVK